MSGTHAPAASLYLLSPQRQADFYSILSRLKADILAGKSALKLPPHLVQDLERGEIEEFSQHVRKPNISPPDQAWKNVSRNASAVAANSQTPQLNWTRQNVDRPRQSGVASSPPEPARQQQFQLDRGRAASRPTTHQIDPILLTKSDDLIQAENKLARERTEQKLAKQWNFGNDGTRKGEVDAYFGPVKENVDDVLNRALALVPPISAHKTNTANENSGVSSFDENSYYSSRVNSWSSDEREYGHRRPPPRSDQTMQRTKSDGVGNDSSAAIREPAFQERLMEQGRRDGSGTNQSVLNKHSQSIAQRTDSTDASRNLHATPSNLPGGNGTNSQTTSNTIQSNPLNQMSNAYDRSKNPPTADTSTSQSASKRVERSESYSPPPPNNTGVSNHVALAQSSQPSRFSPVGGSRPSNIGQVNDGNSASNNNNQNRPDRRKFNRQKRGEIKKGPNQGSTTANNSNTGAPNQLQSRKRRRDGDNWDGDRQASDKRVARGPDSSRAQDFAEPYIKPEPISPPPLSAIPDNSAPRRIVAGADGHPRLEVLAPAPASRRVATLPEYEYTSDVSPDVRATRRDHGRPQMPLDRHDEIPQRVARVSRDENDLRRVASAQYTARPYSANRFDSIVYNSPRLENPRPIRSMSHAERLAPLESQLYDPEPVSPAFPPVPAERYNATLRRRDLSSPQRTARELMPPPPMPPNRGNVFRDEYDNLFLMTPIDAHAENPYHSARPFYQERDTYSEPHFSPLPPLERIRARRHAPEVIEIDSDDDDIRYAPPAQRLRMQEPPTMSAEDLTLAAYRRSMQGQRVAPEPRSAQDLRGYPEQLAMRASSLQPMSHPTADSRQPGSFPAYGNVNPPLASERAYSAAPGAQREDSRRDPRGTQYGQSGVGRTWQRLY